MTEENSSTFGSSASSDEGNLEFMVPRRVQRDSGVPALKTEREREAWFTRQVQGWQSARYGEGHT